MYNRRLADLIATYQIPIQFSFVNFPDVVVQFAQRVPNIAPEKLEVNMVEGTCFTCSKTGHIARDCLKKQEPPMCYQCNTVGHLATKCRVCVVYCKICKNNTHVNDSCFTKRAPRMLMATAGLAQRGHTTQEDRDSSRSKELWGVNFHNCVRYFFYIFVFQPLICKNIFFILKITRLSYMITLSLLWQPQRQPSQPPVFIL